MKLTRLPRKSFKESLKNLWKSWDFKGMLLFGVLAWIPLCVNAIMQGDPIAWIMIVFYVSLVIFTILYSWLKRGA